MMAGMLNDDVARGAIDDPLSLGRPTAIPAR
jgi:hypothetical protein